MSWRGFSVAVSRRKQLAEKRRLEGVWMRSKLYRSSCSECDAEIRRGDSILYFPPPWQEDRAAWLNKETRVRGSAKCESCGRGEQVSASEVLREESESFDVVANW